MSDSLMGSQSALKGINGARLNWFNLPQLSPRFSLEVERNERSELHFLTIKKRSQMEYSFAKDEKTKNQKKKNKKKTIPNTL